MAQSTVLGVIVSSRDERHHGRDKFQHDRLRILAGLRVLKEGYSSAILALEQKSDAIDTELLEYRQHLASGGDPEEERDEEGFLLWDRERLLEMDAEVCKTAVVEAR